MQSFPFLKTLKTGALASLVGWLSLSLAVAQTNAILNYESGKLKEAKEDIDKAIADPKSAGKAKTWYYRGKIYEDLATSKFGAIFDKLDTNAALVAHEAYLKATTVETGGKKPPKEAADALAALTSPGMYGALFNQAVKRFQAQKYPEAIRAFQLAQQANVKDTTSALYSGIAAQQSKDLPLARKEFELYLERGGRDVAVISTVSSLYLNDKDYDKAIAVLKKGMEMHPTSKDLRDQELNVYLASGRTQEAVNNLKAAVQREPTNLTYQTNLGILYDNLGGKAFERADEVEKRADSLETVGRKADSEAKKLTAVKKTADATAKKADAEKARAEAKTVKGEVDKLRAEGQARKDEALEVYKKALAADANNFDANFNAGVYYFNRSVEVGKRLNGMDMKTYQTEGKKTEAELKARFEEALPYFERAHKANPKDLSAMENLRKVYSQLKRQPDVERLTKLIDEAEKK